VALNGIHNQRQIDEKNVIEILVNKYRAYAYLVLKASLMNSSYASNLRLRHVNCSCFTVAFLNFSVKTLSRMVTCDVMSSIPLIPPALGVR